MDLINKLVNLAIWGVIGFFGLGLLGLYLDAKKAREQAPVVDPPQGQGEVQSSPVASAQIQPSPQPPPDPVVPAAAVVVVNDDRPAPNVFSVADFHICIQFSESFSGTVSVFKARKLVKRKIRAISEAAAELMMGAYGSEVFELPPATLTPKFDFEAAVLATEELGIQFIKELLTPKAKGVAPALPSQTPKQTPLPAPDPVRTERALALLRAEMEEPKATPTQTRIEAPMQERGTMVRQSRRPTQSITVGRVIEFGMRAMLFQAGSKGERSGKTFEATIECADGACVSLRGVRLQELFTQEGIVVGDEVEIASLGKTQVTVDGESKYRNEFVVKVRQKA